MMPTCMPTRLLATTDSHSAHVAPRLQSAPHSLDLPYSHPLHTASAPPDEPTLLSALAAYCKSPYPHRSPTTTRARTVPCTERCRYGTRDLASIENCSEGMGHPNQSAGEETGSLAKFRPWLEIVRLSG